MKLNELKKKLYKENPIAVFDSVRKDGIMYTALIGDDGEKITFLVPLNEIGETVWGFRIMAKFLIRYVVEESPN